MREIRLFGSMWRGPETERWQPYSGTKPETADTDKGSLHATAPAPDPTANQQLRCHAEGGRVTKLLRRHACRCGEHDVACGQFDEHEREDGAEEQVVGLQEIASPDVAGMVSQKRGPALPSGRLRSRRAHVLLHRALAGFDSELEQFSANPLGPQSAFSRASVRISATVSAAMRNVGPGRLRQRQRALKPARCQRRSVSGWTIEPFAPSAENRCSYRAPKATRSTFLHIGVMAASATSTIRSSRVTCGRATDCSSTVSWCRSKAISVSNDRRERNRSTRAAAITVTTANMVREHSAAPGGVFGGSAK
jgi:hypothetical protein